MRRVEDLTEVLRGTRISPSTVSALNKKIYARIDEWRNTPIEGAHPPDYPDAPTMFFLSWHFVLFILEHTYSSRSSAMARNQLQFQFQKGMSFAAFQKLYGTEEQCHEALCRNALAGWFCLSALAAAGAIASASQSAFFNVAAAAYKPQSKQVRSFINRKHR